MKLVDNETSPIYYTLVLSQYEKSSTIYYSLRVYSTNQFELKELKDVYNQNYSKKVYNMFFKRIIFCKKNLNFR